MTITAERKPCVARVWTRNWRHDCTKPASVEREGAWYCRIHDPVAVAAKREVKAAEHLRQWEDIARRRRDMAHEEARTEALAGLARELAETRAEWAVDSLRARVLRVLASDWKP